MTVGVAGRGQNGGPAVIGDPDEDLAARGGADGIDGHLDVARRGILDPDRHRQAAGELAVDLALGRPGADGPPGHRIGDVLGNDGVEEFATDGRPDPTMATSRSRAMSQALVDLESAVEIRVVDQTLPSERRPGLLEVDPDDDQRSARSAPATGTRRPA